MLFQRIQAKLTGDYLKLGQRGTVRDEFTAVEEMHHSSHCFQGEICQNQACLEFDMIAKADNDWWLGRGCRLWLIGRDDSLA